MTGLSGQPATTRAPTLSRSLSYLSSESGQGGRGTGRGGDGGSNHEDEGPLGKGLPLKSGGLGSAEGPTGPGGMSTLQLFQVLSPRLAERAKVFGSKVGAGCGL